MNPEGILVLVLGVFILGVGLSYVLGYHKGRTQAHRDRHEPWGGSEILIVSGPGFGMKTKIKSIEGATINLESPLSD